ncbi:MAG: D-glycero-beta-D-manno-heptose 1-phosphate adenylyltransferase [Desulfovibrio sp.]|nr:D-glycero-beta-D-manno-heptose 1-phosphate adenylyltransferase [Desulfovibrio sp.]
MFAKSSRSLDRELFLQKAPSSFNENAMEPTFRKRILVIGDTMLDHYTETTVRRISAEAPVPIATVAKEWDVPGGAANVAKNLACLGCSVTLIGVRAKDAHGIVLQDLLEESQIIAPSLVVNDRPTITKNRIISNGQQLLRLDTEINRPLPPDIVPRVLAAIENALPWAEAVICSDYGKGLLGSPVERETIVSFVIKRCQEAHIPVCIDPKGHDWTQYAHATCITPNTHELAAILNRQNQPFEDLIQPAKHLMNDLSLRALLVTRGPQGMSLLEGDGVTTIATKAREVSDVSGAGDTVIAVFCAALAEGFSFEQAATIANRAAGIVVGRVGTSPIHREELLQAISHNPLKESLTSLGEKILSRERLFELVHQWRQMGQSVVFTNGCFDLVHPGHVKLLHEAANQGDKLIVAINSDASVKRLKGPNRPIQSEQARALVMASMERVDAVVVFEEDTPLPLIAAIKPDVLVKGGDYTPETVVGSDVVLGCGGRIHLVDLAKGFSTTDIVATIGEQ